MNPDYSQNPITCSSARCRTFCQVSLKSNRNKVKKSWESKAWESRYHRVWPAPPSGTCPEHWRCSWRCTLAWSSRCASSPRTGSTGSEGNLLHQAAGNRCKIFNQSWIQDDSRYILKAEARLCARIPHLIYLHANGMYAGVYDPELHPSGLGTQPDLGYTEENGCKRGEQTSLALSKANNTELTQTLVWSVFTGELLHFLLSAFTTGYNIFDTWIDSVQPFSP